MEISFSVVVVGLDASGKTTMLKSMAGSKEQIFPTPGYSIVELKIPGISKPVLVYDCSGAGIQRYNWRIFYAEVNGIIFVIDSADLQRFIIAKQLLQDLTQDPLVIQKKLPICIMLNKQDISQIEKEVLFSGLEIEKLKKNISKIYVKETSGYKKSGIQECFLWLNQNRIL